MTIQHTEQITSQKKSCEGGARNTLARRSALNVLDFLDELFGPPPPSHFLSLCVFFAFCRGAWAVIRNEPVQEKEHSVCFRFV